MWIDTTTFPPYKPNLKKICPPAALRPGRRREGAGVGRSACTGNPAFGSPRRLQEPREFAHFSGGRKVLDSFSIFCALDKQTSRTRRFWACPRGSAGGLGEGRRLRSIPKENSLRLLRSLQAGLSGSERTLSSWVVGDATQQGAPSPAQESAGSRQGPPKHEAVRRLRRGPGSPLQPSPSRDRIPS